MPDMEKVIKGLETIKQFFGYGLPSTAEMFDSYYGILNDALAMLKEQEPVEAVDDPDDPLLAFCGECGHTLGFRELFKYCPYCGKAVKWE